MAAALTDDQSDMVFEKLLKMFPSPKVCTNFLTSKFFVVNFFD